MKVNQIVLGGLAVLGLSAIAIAANVRAATDVIHPLNMGNWMYFQEVSGASGMMVNGPGTPPMGSGSAQLTVDSSGRGLLLNTAFSGTRFDQITSLSYSSFSQTPAQFIAPTLQFDADYDTTDASTVWQGRLVFEPYMTATVTPGVWQTWQPLSGNWWMSWSSPANVCPQSDPCTWSEFLTAYPTSAVRPSGMIQFKWGGPWSGGYTGNVDAFTIGINNVDTTFDFEASVAPTPTPTPSPTPTASAVPTKQDCKKGGWLSTAFSYLGFKNQGSCVSSTVPEN